MILQIDFLALIFEAIFIFEIFNIFLLYLVESLNYVIFN